MTSEILTFGSSRAIRLGGSVERSGGQASDPDGPPSTGPRNRPDPRGRALAEAREAKRKAAEKVEATIAAE